MRCSQSASSLLDAIESFALVLHGRDEMTERKTKERHSRLTGLSLLSTYMFLLTSCTHPLGLSATAGNSYTSQRILTFSC